MDAEKFLVSYPDGIAVFDLSLTVRFANPAIAEMLEIPRAPAGAAAGEIFPHSPEIIELLKTFFEKGGSYLNYDFPLQIAKNRSIPVELSINDVSFSEEESGAGLIIRPTEGRKLLHREIEKDEKMAALSVMAAGLAHEIKNPLGGIRGTAQLIGESNADLAEYCELIIKETDRISGLVTDLLDLGGKRKTRRKRTNIHKVIDDTIKLMTPLFERKDIEIMRDFDPSIPEITAAPDRLKQVFINLTKNGVEMMENGGKLRIRTRVSLAPATLSSAKAKKSMMMSIEFIDTGKGIPPEISKNLFTPFNTSKPSGTGLGLIISLQIVRDHGGTLTLENNPNGKGATTRVRLPLS